MKGGKVPEVKRTDVEASAMALERAYAEAVKAHGAEAAGVGWLLVHLRLVERLEAARSRELVASLWAAAEYLHADCGGEPKGRG